LQQSLYPQQVALGDLPAYLVLNAAQGVLAADLLAVKVAWELVVQAKCR